METLTPREVPATLNRKLTLEAFNQLSGILAGVPFVKVVVDRTTKNIHFINNTLYAFHSDYIGKEILNIEPSELDKKIDEFNQSVYLSADKDRRFFLGVVALQRKNDRKFFTLETVEIDNMDKTMLAQFYSFVKMYLDTAIPFLFKPANHEQEMIVKQIDIVQMPRIFNHEIFASASFVPLNAGVTTGRLRIIRNEMEYRAVKNSIEWYDVIVMSRVPDDIPRVAGIINSSHTTPLSHTNVLAAGWQVPNSTQIGILEELSAKGLDGQWVKYAVEMNSSQIVLEKIDRPSEIPQRPAWSIHTIRLEAPETINIPIVELDRLRMSDRFKYGTKAANLGEMCHILQNGSERLLGFYKASRPPRPNLLPYLAKLLNGKLTNIREDADSVLLAKASLDFIRQTISIPRGIAIPFSIQQTVLEASPKVQQAIGKLKMALELNTRDIDPICLQLQQMIRNIRIPESIRDYIDNEMAERLGGVSSFVVRSSSNAEDLEGFSAAGMYESVIHVTTVEKLFDAIRRVWASLISPRSVRLMHQVGISLDDCYMGVIVQVEAASRMGGVMVTTNPLNRKDFRNVYINASLNSVTNVVQGDELPYQFLFNTVEGGGRTLSLGDGKTDLDEDKKRTLQDLAIVGRLLQSHFSPDYTFTSPMDVEWVAGDEGICIVQLRPYAK